MIRVVLAGATGWVGRALLPAIAESGDLKLVAAVSRKAAGRDAGEAVGAAPLGVKIVATLAEALGVPSDVLVDYTKPDVVGRNVLDAIAAGRHVVVGTSGLGADDYAAIDKAARAKGVGVLAAGNFSIQGNAAEAFRARSPPLRAGPPRSSTTPSAEKHRTRPSRNRPAKLAQRPSLPGRRRPKP